MAAVDLDALANCLYFAGGITKTLRVRGREVPYRAAAWTGKLYHVDLYAVAGPDVAGLDAGVYHFDPRADGLDVLREGDYRGVLAAASGRRSVAAAPAAVVATSTWWRNAWFTRRSCGVPRGENGSEFNRRLLN